MLKPIFCRVLCEQRELPASKGKQLIGVARASSWRGPYTMITPSPIEPERWWCIAECSFLSLQRKHGSTPNAMLCYPCCHHRYCRRHHHRRRRRHRCRHCHCQLPAVAEYLPPFGTTAMMLLVQVQAKKVGMKSKAVLGQGWAKTLSYGARLAVGTSYIMACAPRAHCRPSADDAPRCKACSIQSLLDPKPARSKACSIQNLLDPKPARSNPRHHPEFSCRFRARR